MSFPIAPLSALALVLSLAGAIFLMAQAYADGRLLPEIPPAKGDRCVEPTEIMRRSHMEFLLHQRDETVHHGIRTEQHRFVNCIDCHVQARADGTYPRHVDADHFCQGCHVFSSVSVDCFQCHADRPLEAYVRRVDGLKEQVSRLR